LNEATLVAGALILLIYLLFEVLFVGWKQELPVSINSTTAAVAALSVAYGLIGFRMLIKKMSLLAGLTSFLLLSASVGALVYSTGGLESQYLLLWVVVVLFSAMFGWSTFMLTWLATHLYILLLLLGVIDTTSGVGLDGGRLIIYMVALELPFAVSLFLWYGQSGGNTGTVSVVDDTVGAEDVDQDVLISSIAEGVIVIDHESRIQVFNPAAATTSGWSESDARGIDYRSVLKLVDAKGQPLSEDINPINQVFNKAQTVVDNNMRLLTRNNKAIDLSFVASPITRADGGISAVVAVFRDITTEKDQERQRAEFISTASHEMRTPVAAIEGYLALAMNDAVSKVDSKARGYLEKAHESTQHLGKLFQDLLTAAKSEDGRLQFNPEVVEVGSLIDKLAEDARFTAEKKGLIMEYDFAGGPDSPEVAGAQVVRPLYFAHVDPERLREVVTNLFDNAVKYTPEGKVIIRLTGDDDNTLISVSDTGLGIPQEDISHLFQKFYRVDNTETRQIGGTGLGLFISRKIVEKLGGKIWVESQLGQGSTFFVSLPRLSPEKADTLKKQQAAKETPLAHVSAAVEL
jgi:PAS domain S-box-containing protein